MEKSLKPSKGGVFDINWVQIWFVCRESEWKGVKIVMRLTKMKKIGFVEEGELRPVIAVPKNGPSPPGHLVRATPAIDLSHTMSEQMKK